MADDLVSALRRNLFEVFGNPDGESRRAAIEELYTPDCVCIDDNGRQSGLDGVERIVVGLQKAMPGFEFKEVGHTQALADAGRLSWTYGPPGQPPVVTGQDLALFRDGRIAVLYTFIDAA